MPYNRPVCKIYPAVSISINDNTATVIDFDTVDYDINSEASLTGNSITLSHDGHYMIVLAVGVTGDGSDTALDVTLQIKADDTTIHTERCSSGKYANLVTTHVDYFTKGTVFTAFVTADGNSSAKKINAGKAQTYLATYFLKRNKT